MSSYVDSNKKMDWAKEFSRTFPEPLDRSSMFGSYADAVKYAAGDVSDPDSRQLCGNSYVGQIISVYENDVVAVYTIEADRTLKPLGDTGSTESWYACTVDQTRYADLSAVLANGKVPYTIFEYYEEGYDIPIANYIYAGEVTEGYLLVANRLADFNGVTVQWYFIVPKQEPTPDYHWDMDYLELETGATDYNDLANRPQINGYVLSGNQTAAQLNLQKILTPGNYITIDQDGKISGNYPVYSGERSPKGLVPAAPPQSVTDKFLGADGTWKKPTVQPGDIPIATPNALGGIKSQTTGTAENRDYNVEVDQSTGTAKVNVPWEHYGIFNTAAHGLVPKPAAADVNKFLRGDHTWQAIDIPTKVSQLENDNHYLTLETLPRYGGEFSYE